MKKAIVLVLFILAGCTYVTDCIPGSGNTISQERQIDSAFDSIEVLGSANIYITQGHQSDLLIKGDDNVLNITDTYVSGRTLIIENSNCIRNARPVDITLSMEDIKELKVSGFAKIETMNEIEADAIDITISGSGDFTLKGTADSLNVKISGSGNIDAVELETKSSEVSISGSGNVKVYAKEELDISIAGSGKVQFKGTPKLTQSVAGSGNVESLT